MLGDSFNVFDCAFRFKSAGFPVDKLYTTTVPLTNPACNIRTMDSVTTYDKDVIVERME
jgi:hypothetical protein